MQGNNYDSRSYESGGQGYHYSLARLPLPFHRPPLRYEMTSLCRSAPRAPLSRAPPRPFPPPRACRYADLSYYYSNPNGSTYHESDSGQATYTTGSGQTFTADKSGGNTGG
jgi:hypothetical protein